MSADKDHELLDQFANLSVDKPSANESLMYFGSAVWTACMPLFLYVNVLDLELTAIANLTAAVAGASTGSYYLYNFYHEQSKKTKHFYHKDVRTTAGKGKSKGSNEDNTIIAKKSVAWSLFFNNLIFLFCAAFFGFWFFKTQYVEVNIGLTHVFTFVILFFANQES